MSSDDGWRPEDQSVDFATWFEAARDERGMTLSEHCQRAQVSNEEYWRAVEAGSYGVEENGAVLMRLLAVLRADLSALLAGIPVTPDTPVFEKKVEKIVGEYIYRAHVPPDEREPLKQEVKNILKRAPKHSFQEARRAGVPRKWTDVGWIHEALRKRMKK